jgi:tetratricopeptide (TPR) repeat protein
LKAAGNELRYFNQVFEARIPSLRIPLTCTIDCCGFRITAMSILPIGRRLTLKYGSSDGGKSIKVDPSFEALMEKLAKVLNLAKHLCGKRITAYNTSTESKATLFTCIDIEGHQGNDRRNYVIDVARLFPPEYVEQPQENKYLYENLRPELVRSWRKPLNPDAFSPFDMEDSQTKAQHENEIRMCTQHMKQVIVSNFVTKLLHKCADNIALQFFTADRLIVALHHAGINVRHLGLVRKELESRKRTNNTDQGADMSNIGALSELILLEMISRVIKNGINTQMREQMAKINAPSFQPFDKIVIEFFNKLLCDESLWKSPETSSIKSPETSSIRWGITHKFGPVALTEEEKSSNRNIAPTSPLQLISRLEELLGVRLYPEAKSGLRYFFGRSTNRNVLSIEDIQYRDVRVKYLSLLSYANAISDFQQAQKTDDEIAKHRLLAKALRNFEISGLSSYYTPANAIYLKEVMNMWGDALFEYGLLIELDPLCQDRHLSSLRLKKEKIGFDESGRSQKTKQLALIQTEIKGAKYYFERALRKYQRTNSTDKIFKLAIEGSRKFAQLLQQIDSLMLHSPQEIEKSVREILTFLKTILGDNYCVPIEKNVISAIDADRLSGALYRVALGVPNDQMRKPLLQASGRYFEECIRLNPSTYTTISPLVSAIKEKEDIAHIANVYRINRTLSSPTRQENLTDSSTLLLSQPPTSASRQVIITKFYSSWAPKVSSAAFTALVELKSLTTLALDDSNCDPEIWKQLPSVAKHLPNLERLVLHKCQTITSGEVLAMLDNCTELKRLIISYCLNVKPEDFKAFVQKRPNVEVVINFQQVTPSGEVQRAEPKPDQKYYTTGLIRGKRTIAHLFPKDDRIVTSFSEFTHLLERLMRGCKLEICSEFVVNG